jgi:hypothetical protein
LLEAAEPAGLALTHTSGLQELREQAAALMWAQPGFEPATSRVSGDDPYRRAIAGLPGVA